jgi:hypothetical protein
MAGSLVLPILLSAKNDLNFGNGKTVRHIFKPRKTWATATLRFYLQPRKVWASAVVRSPVQLGINLWYVCSCKYATYSIQPRKAWDSATARSYSQLELRQLKILLSAKNRFVLCQLQRTPFKKGLRFSNSKILLTAWGSYFQQRIDLILEVVRSFFQLRFD